MSFIKEIIGEWMLSTMEDPVKRREWWNDHIRIIEAKAQKRLDVWRQPVKSWGFWRTKWLNYEYELQVDPVHQNCRGRPKSKYEY